MARLQNGWEATGRSYTRPVAERQVVVLGRYRDLLYVNGAACQADAAAEVAAPRKEEKYADLDSRYLFEPIAVETLGVLNSSANSLLKETGNKISLNTGESKEISFQHQRILVLVQCFNAILLQDSLPTINCTD